MNSSGPVKPKSKFHYKFVKILLSGAPFGKGRIIAPFFSFPKKRRSLAKGTAARYPCCCAWERKTAQPFAPASFMNAPYAFTAS